VIIGTLAFDEWTVTFVQQKDVRVHTVVLPFTYILHRSE